MQICVLRLSSRRSWSENEYWDRGVLKTEIGHRGSPYEHRRRKSEAIESCRLQVPQFVINCTWDSNVYFTSPRSPPFPRVQDPTA